MTLFAKVVKLHEEFQLSTLTKGALYPVLEGDRASQDLGYDFALIDDDGDKMPFRWVGDVEAVFERVEK